MYLACESGHSDIVRVLLEAGANFRTKTLHGDSPIGVACLSKKIDIVQQLLECNASVNVSGEYYVRDAQRVNSSKSMIRGCAPTD